MTITNIKKFIDENTEGIYESIEGSIFDCSAFRRMHETLEKVKSMLDQLEPVDQPKANWECDKKNLKASILRDTIHKCSNCGNISLHHTYYCCNCGAKMKKVINPNTKEEWNFREGL